MTPDTATSPTSWRPPGLVRSTLRRHWLGILAAWLLGSGALYAITDSSLPPIYRAFSLIRVEPDDAGGLCTYPGTAIDLDPYLLTQVQRITSPTVLSVAAASPKVAMLERIARAGDAVQELREAVEAGVRPNTYLIEVAMTSPNASETATIVNAIVDAFMAANDASPSSMARREIEGLEKYQVDLKDQIDELERQWKILGTREDLFIAAKGGQRWVLSDREASAIEDVRQAREQRNIVEMELARARAWLATAQEDARKVAQGQIAADKGERMNRQVERRLMLDPEVSKLDQDIQAIEMELKDLNRRRLSPGDPAIKAIYRKLDDLGRGRRKLWDDRTQALREQVEPLGREFNPEQEIQEAEATVNKLLTGQAMLREKYAKLDVGRARSANEVFEITRLQDGWKTLKPMKDAVDRRLWQLRRDPGAKVRIRPVSPNGVSVPTRPIPDPRRLIVEMIPIITLFGVVGLRVSVKQESGRMDSKAEPMREV